LYGDLARFRALPKSHTFTAAESEALANWVDGLQNKTVDADVAPNLSKVAQNAEAAKN
jgi:hypothetical protein